MMSSDHVTSSNHVMSSCGINLSPVHQLIRLRLTWHDGLYKGMLEKGYKYDV